MFILLDSQQFFPGPLHHKTVAMVVSLAEYDLILLYDLVRLLPFLLRPGDGGRAFLKMPVARQKVASRRVFEETLFDRDDRRV